MCEREDYSTSELIRLVESDPGVASRLLRLANSAYYGLRRKVSTLGGAVVLLGRVTVEAIALTASILRLCRYRKIPAAAEKLWVHSYLSALGCRFLAQRLPASAWHSGAETLFLTGLLHDLGKLLFLAEAQEGYLETLETACSAEELLLLEEDRFGCNHAEAAGEALDKWDFPAAISMVVRYHHLGGLRAEFRGDWEILRAVDETLGAEPADVSHPPLPETLLADLTAHLYLARPQAEAIFHAIS